ncbi:hypothetical protein [Flavivirga sp. 57AJ16]|uniref:hypothetical protein n=1 Tax=Flavivirga sp. 57AJ16 TaxID=3025307 RepID=UPI002365F4D9|nr:hypothetical protein [Flavivirga sp. 57AJ16]MDD7885416.1 hypothetical protein [Flavivirga sp. 57AJ16]
MGHSNKIKSLSEKMAHALIKNGIPSDLEKLEIFKTESKGQMLSDIKEGKCLKFLN